MASSSFARHRWTLGMTRRVRFTGRLHMTSALHVGGGVGTTSVTDAGVLLTPDGRPFVPGSSMKGVLRSHLERLAQAPALAATGLESCLLYADDPDATTGPSCPSPGWIDAGKDATTAEERDFEALCHTCTLFGSPILAGKVRVPDLHVVPDTYPGDVEIRDGVGIDRDRGRPVDSIKFDYEVVPAGTAFQFELSADSPDAAELALLAIAVRELQNGHIAIGAKTTRGLGSCQLRSVSVEDARLDSVAGLRDYLQARAEGETTAAPNADDFLRTAVDGLLGA